MFLVDLALRVDRVQESLMAVEAVVVELVRLEPLQPICRARVFRAVGRVQMVALAETRIA